MAIPDPQAIPETAEACVEYLQEADAAWNNSDTTTAWHLYHSLFESALNTGDQSSHAAYRLALIALNANDHEQARRFASASHDPGAADLLHSLDNAAGPVTVDPDQLPTSDEAAEKYWEEGTKARQAGDFTTAARWFGAVAQSTDTEPGVRAWAEVLLALCAHELGDDTTARSWLDKAFPNISGDEAVQAARDLYEKIGVHSRDDNTSPAAHQLVAGIEAYQSGDAAGARAALEAALHLDGATEEIKGRADFYLGAMAYQEHRYAEARDHLDHAVAEAPEPEKTWAHDILQQRWEEN